MAAVIDDLHQQSLERRHRLEHALIGAEPLARARPRGRGCAMTPWNATA